MGRGTDTGPAAQPRLLFRVVSRCFRAFGRAVGRAECAPLQPGRWRGVWPCRRAVGAAVPASRRRRTADSAPGRRSLCGSERLCAPVRRGGVPDVRSAAPCSRSQFHPVLSARRGAVCVSAAVCGVLCFPPPRRHAREAQPPPPAVEGGLTRHAAPPHAPHHRSRLRTRAPKPPSR